MTIDVKSLQFGTDAEVLLRTITGHPFPVCGLFGGTKDKPTAIPSLGEGFAHQEDNAAYEFNIPPTHYFRDFAAYIQWSLDYARKKLPDSLQLDYEHSSLVFNEEYLKIPQMQVFGCDPDYNAYTMQANERPIPPQPGLRTAAAHLHIGWKSTDGSPPTDEDRLELIRLLDMYAVLPTIRKQTAEDARRRVMYGKAGSFRPKEYGVEHRVLPNTWIGSKIQIRELMYRVADSVAALNAGVKVANEDYVKVQTAINNPHKVLAVMLNELYKRKFANAVGPGWDSSAFYKNFQHAGEYSHPTEQVLATNG